MQDDVTRSLLETFVNNIEKNVVQHPIDDSIVESYRHAAAVLHCFSVDSLNPIDMNLKHMKPSSLLYDEIVTLAGGISEGLYTLKPVIRRATLKKMNSRTRMKDALLANPARIKTPLQNTWEDYLFNGFFPDLEKLNYQELTNIAQILSWLDNAFEDLPELDYVIKLLRRRSIMVSFEHLVAADFTGREAELKIIRDYVGRALTGKVASKPFLSICGVGGIGKSALVGKVLMEFALADVRDRIPFAYLAFDQDSLRIETPFTILVEAASQFSLQFPEHQNDFVRFDDSVKGYRDKIGAIGERRDITESNNSRNDILTTIQTLHLSLYEAFAALLSGISRQFVDGRETLNPVVIILDTFEEVQYRDRESLQSFWKMLEAIRISFPMFRVIIAGRVSVMNQLPNPSLVEEKPLNELVVNDRVLLLKRLGVRDTVVAKAIAEQIGGNPLSLRLAANVVNSDKKSASEKGIVDLTTRKWLFFQIDEQIIQGRLYSRILDHIHNPDVRKIAHPGMVLRQITPDVILYVLAPVCKIEVSSLSYAESLFNELSREYSLVKTGATGNLIFQTDIRRAMIHMLVQDKFGEVKELHRAAIRYYSSRSSLEDRAEELYHRLALGEGDFDVLDSRWEKGIEHSVISDLDEYPERVQVWLASRANLEVDREVFAKADIETWERNIFRKVKKAMANLEIDFALKLLKERKERSVASPLFALESKVHLLNKNLQTSWEVLEVGIDSVAKSYNRGRLAELLWLQAQLAILRGNFVLADDRLRQAETAIEKSSNPLTRIQILCHRLMLRKESDAPYRDKSYELLLRLNNACAATDNEVWKKARHIATIASKLMENEFPKTSKQLAILRLRNYVQPQGLLLTENIQGIEQYRENWENDDEDGIDAIKISL